MPTKEEVNPVAPLAAQLLEELSIIAAQNEAGKGASDEQRKAKRALTAMAEKLDDLSESLIEQTLAVEVAEGEEAATKESVEEALSYVHDCLVGWAELVLPSAEVTWNREEANAKVGILAGFGSLGYLTEQQMQDIDKIKGQLAVRQSSSGPRNPQETIEGRPALISIADPDGKVFSKQKGNVQTSVGNIKTRAVDWIKQATKVEVVSDEIQAGLIVAIRKVCAGESTTEVFGGLTFAVVTEAEATVAV